MPLFVKLAVVTNYIVQYERYSNELCIYKDIDESSCNGKCQMMKELNQTEPKSPSTPHLPEFKLKDQPIDFSHIYNCINHPQIKLTNWLEVDSPQLHSRIIKGIFHPPC